MKKFIMLAVAVFVVIGTAFAANPADDFEYKLSNDGKYVVICGFKNQKSVYVIPEIIEDFPVREVDINKESAKIFENVKQVTITLNNNIKNFKYVETHHWNQAKAVPIFIDGLSENITECQMISMPSLSDYTFHEKEMSSPHFKPVTIKGSIEVLKNAKKLCFTNVQFEKKSITVQKAWDEYSFWCTNLEEVKFEEGIIKTGSFAYNNKLKKVTFSSSIHYLGASDFHNCPSLSELVIPNGITYLKFDNRYPAETFTYTNLSLKTQAKLIQLGYKGSFFISDKSNDLEYILSEDAKYIIVTGFRNNKAKYIIPEAIEGIPVLEVSVTKARAPVLFGNVKQVLIMLPKGITYFELWINDVLNDITIDGLSESIKEFYVFSEDRNPFANMSSPPSDKYKPIIINGSMELLSGAKTVVCRNVRFEKTSITIKKSWDEYVFSNTNLEEISFENGIAVIGKHIRSCDGFAHNKKLKKVSLPSSIKEIADRTFCNCPQLSEVIIPDEVTYMKFYDRTRIFEGTALSLKTQARLKQLGYHGAF